MKMKKLLLIALVLFGLSACQKDDSEELSPEVETTPSAVSSTNSSSAGVYKGVMVGSSGYFKISIKNGDNLVFCTFKLDGKEATLTTTSLDSWTPGQPITNAVFTGTWDGRSVSLTFSCQANGSNPTISVTVPGHTVNVSLYKETSTTLVKCYEGSYMVATPQGNVPGTWNCVVYGNLMVGYHADIESQGPIAGNISGNTLTMENATLTINDSSISGSFLDGNGYTITVTGKRTL